MVDFALGLRKLSSFARKVISWPWELRESQVENGCAWSSPVVISVDEDPENGENGCGESSPGVTGVDDHPENGENGSGESSPVVTGIDHHPENRENGSEESIPVVIGLAFIVAECMDSVFPYIPFLIHTDMCLGMNRDLWKVAVALRIFVDIFTALALLRQLSRHMSSIKSILLMCLKFLVLAPIPQILFSEQFILKTLGGYTVWDLILFCLYGARFLLIFQSCEQLKTRVSSPKIDLFLYLIICHFLGVSWYYFSIKRLLSCWNHVCKIDTGCISLCYGTTPSTLNSTRVNEFCPINPPNAAVFNFGIFLDALQSGIVEDKGVLKKFLKCLFWGLQNLSSFASNLRPSNAGEFVFAIIIIVVAMMFWRNVFCNGRTEEGTSVPRETELEP